MINFKVTRKESATIKKIVQRALDMGIYGTPMQINMDLTAVHANGCPLRLDELYEADDFNFAHDVRGIACHLDRETGKLGDCFVPRFAAPVEVA